MTRSRGRQPGIHTKHLTEEDRRHVRILYLEGGKSKEEIQQRTGFSAAQVRRAISSESTAIGKRSGRPSKIPKPIIDGSSWSQPIYFDSPQALGHWLAYNHNSKPELFVGYYKKHTGRAVLTWSDAVDEALCWGWIDGMKRKVDDDRMAQRFTPRTKYSHWSRVNVDKMALLEAAGRVREPGRIAFARRLEENTAQMSHERDVVLRDDFIERLRIAGPANFYLAQRTPGYRRQVFHWIMTAKRPETQERRFQELMVSSAQGEDVKHFRRK
ncbi:hypothetical protein PFICI_03359 [Pestalotiopsis fici W106-1]|uniref:Uncharacterized protein n=1 Tax=Pestalotiopsis fici (strain W106-1 / CGMCC3.15140) TaxID=1229662 RepID=W3XH62_PESFW|nr:uncharacterized protein PFICI_03359 [Pestalotiopsis fici W106-1]ETS85334.1 hypothetical protein PFICI_03359 [Pestalotiopsis fici W106-1]